MESFKYTVSSRSKLFNLHLKETFLYRDLIFLFVKRDFISLYKQTILGPLWAIIQPLMTTIVFTLVFGNMAKLTTADVAGDVKIPSFLFFMSGCICWNFFSAVVNATSFTFLANQGTMGKVYYPRLVAPVATAFSQLISFAIQLAMFFLLTIIVCLRGECDIKLTPVFLLIVPLILHMMILAVGCGILISSVTTKYRDLSRLVGFGLQLWQFGSPIAYGLGLVPVRYLHWYMLNPVTPIITTFRYAVFGFGYFNFIYYVVSLALSLLVFFIGLILFSRIERTFMDTI